MSQEPLFTMPSRAELETADPEGFILQFAPEQGLRVSLLEVREGVPMDARFECYSLMLALPVGVTLPSDVYRLFGPEGQQWLLLLTQVMPEPDGRNVLEGVIHREVGLATSTES
ncbi:DUF6916 family protein [Pseudomonas sp. 5P_5.1_Bac1]|uniref:DUF6916 family protein n=1 Tax=Pseudomonas sp. 5P_5.1_Bac1 TaxID=2971616 RepID=UPI0021C5C60B|nr:hypothetical protein [Pseudomonas sp. 5P_5.1_Bac1]MCU1723636.1 hypothetical protein [Pseudomonas sp. 5P_5.1_Bac1]